MSELTKTLHLILFVACACIMNAAQAAFNYDPTLSWQTLDTPHFRIHFHDGEEALAQEVAAITERAHERLKNLLKWEPAEATHVVLSNRTDISNGTATPFPRNTMHLLVTPPDNPIALDDYSAWLELLITHEYTHILHLDKVHKAPALLRGGFGRMPLLFPNVLQPAWLIEGLATYVETDIEHGIGRGQSSLFKQMMRLEVANGIKPIHQVNQAITTWPAAATPYLYGVYFYNFIRDRYGPSRIPAMIEDYSGRLIPLRINSMATAVYGKNMPALWEEFRLYLATRFDPQIEDIRHRGIVAGERLTHYGYYTGAPVIADNGDSYFVRNDWLSEPQLIRRNAKGTEQELARVNGDRLSLHAHAGLLLVQIETLRSVNHFGDIYHYDIDQQRLRRLTSGGRYRFAAWHPDGLRILAVKNHGDSTSLELLDRNGHVERTLWQGERGIVVADPVWSPQGDFIVASLLTPGGSWNLARFNLDSGSWSNLTRDPANEIQPRFAGDGRAVYYSADYGGVYNLQRLDLESGVIRTLSNVLGGAFSPAISSDGQTLQYVGATADGYDLFQLAVDDLRNEPAFLGSETVLPVAAYYQDVGVTSDAALARAPQAESRLSRPELTPRPYAAEESVFPTWWIPYFNHDRDHTELGVSTGGGDVLQRHQYNVLAAYDAKNEWWLGSANYLYDRWNPALAFTLSREILTFLRSDGSFDRTRNHDSLALQAIIPVLNTEQQWSVHIGWVRELETDRELADNASDFPSAREQFVGLALTYNSSHQAPRAVSPHEGRQLNLIATDNELLGSDFNGQVYTVDWREYHLLGNRRQVLYTRLASGWGTESPRPFRLGGADPLNVPTNPLNSLSFSTVNLFDERDFRLRGYPEGLPDLQDRRMLLGEVEWRFPLLQVERGLMVPPVGWFRTHGRIFFSSGDAFDDDFGDVDWHSSAGIEVHNELFAGYRLPVLLRLGYAVGFGENGERQFYLNLNAPLL